jgi:hypothetical protein
MKNVGQPHDPKERPEEFKGQGQIKEAKEILSDLETWPSLNYLWQSIPLNRTNSYDTLDLTECGETLEYLSLLSNA